MLNIETECYSKNEDTSQRETLINLIDYMFHGPLPTHFLSNHEKINKLVGVVNSMGVVK